MFNSSKLTANINTLVKLIAAVAVVAIVVGTAKHHYDAEIKTETVTVLKIEAHTQEVKAIESANAIKHADSTLTHVDVIKQLQQRGDFRKPAKPDSRSEQTQRVQQSLEDSPIKKRHTEDTGASEHSEQNTRTPLPAYGIDCRVTYGFDHNDKIVLIETCNDG